MESELYRESRLSEIDCRESRESISRLPVIHLFCCLSNSLSILFLYPPTPPVSSFEASDFLFDARLFLFCSGANSGYGKSSLFSIYFSFYNRFFLSSHDSCLFLCAIFVASIKPFWRSRKASTAFLGSSPCSTASTHTALSCGVLAPAAMATSFFTSALRFQLKCGSLPAAILFLNLLVWRWCCILMNRFTRSFSILIAFSRAYCGFWFV